MSTQTPTPEDALAADLPPDTMREPSGEPDEAPNEPSEVGHSSVRGDGGHGNTEVPKNGSDNVATSFHTKLVEEVLRRVR
jgi:hypothetical protein